MYDTYSIKTRFHKDNWHWAILFNSILLGSHTLCVQNGICSELKYKPGNCQAFFFNLF